MSREPNPLDEIAYGIADGTGSVLEKGLKRELGKKKPDGWSILFHGLGIFGTELAKALVNDDLDPKLESRRDLDGREDEEEAELD